MPRRRCRGRWSRWGSQRRRHGGKGGVGRHRVTRRSCRRRHWELGSSTESTGAEPPANVPKLPNGSGDRQNNGTAAHCGHTRHNQRAADTKFLVGNSQADRRQACQNQAHTDDQQSNHHRTNPRKTRLKIGAATNATIPSYCPRRQPPIVDGVPENLAHPDPGAPITVRADVNEATPVYLLATNCCQFIAMHREITPQ
jgi:hypothetical protein